jgi:hypothetical protein
MSLANLIEKSRLTRKFSVVTTEGVFDVVYDGKGLGYEEILVDGQIAKRTPSFWWYIPRFEFEIGSLPAVVLVSVSAALKIDKFSLLVDDIVVYDE